MKKTGSMALIYVQTVFDGVRSLHREVAVTFWNLGTRHTIDGDIDCAALIWMRRASRWYRCSMLANYSIQSRKFTHTIRQELDAGVR
jgi:hypothetical protein